MSFTPDPRSAAVLSGRAPGGAGLRRYRHLIASFVVNDLQTRYAGSSVGLFWTVGKPVLELLTYTFVFTILLRVKFRADFDTLQNALYLFCGYIAWLTVSESVLRTGNIIRENGHLIKKVHFPPAILPLHVCLAEVVSQALRFAVLLLAALLAGNPPSGHVAWVLPILVLQIAFTCGICMLVSCAAVYFKDVVQILPSVLLIWMFVTPIFYSDTAYPPLYKPILVLNPVSQLVGMYRLVLLEHQPPLPGQVAVFAAAAVLSLALGAVVFHRHSYEFADLV